MDSDETPLKLPIAQPPEFNFARGEAKSVLRSFKIRLTCLREKQRTHSRPGKLDHMSFSTEAAFPAGGRVSNFRSLHAVKIHAAIHVIDN